MATPPSETPQQGQIFVITGPSGVGKGTLCRRLLQDSLGLMLSVSATSRPKRPEEVDGQDYFFMAPQEFLRLVDSGEMLEWAQYHNHYYGTPKQPVVEALQQGKHVLLEIDVQGALAVKENFPQAHLIFIMPPSLDALRQRLVGRKTNTPTEIDERLTISKHEMTQTSYFETVLINDDLNTCYEGLRHLIQREISGAFQGNIP